MPLLIGAIPEQNFEIVRDRIGIILADELPSQATLNANPDLDAKVSSERFIPVGHTDTPLVNVALARGNFDNNKVVSTDGTYTYFIDVYTSSPSSDGVDGDAEASRKLHRLLGVIRAILEAPVYNRLGLAPPSLSNTTVVDIQIQEPVNNQDAASVVMGRITFSVRVCERVELIVGNLIDSYQTTIKLNDTDKGYFYESV